MREGVVYSDAPTSKNWALKRQQIYFSNLLPRSEKASEPEPDKCLKRADAGIDFDLGSLQLFLSMWFVRFKKIPSQYIMHVNIYIKLRLPYICMYKDL